ncbi:MAG: hypothetical protein ACLPGW_04580 [Roseiarcus sp.]
MTPTDAGATRFVGRLAVIILAYNEARHIGRAIGSARAVAELWRKLGDGGEEGGVTGLVIKPPEPPRWSVTP